MSESIEEKQLFLRNEIIDQGYNPEAFSNYMASLRGENGLDLDGISIYPHNNTSLEEYPDTLVVGDETYQKADLIKVAGEYGEYYLLQDNFREDGLTDVSIIKSTNGNLELYTENEGKIWIVKGEEIVLSNKIELNNQRKI